MQMQRQTRAPSSSGCAHANDGLAQSWPGRRLRGLSRAQPGLSGTAGPGVPGAASPSVRWMRCSERSGAAPGQLCRHSRSDGALLLLCKHSAQQLKCSSVSGAYPLWLCQSNPRSLQPGWGCAMGALTAHSTELGPAPDSPCSQITGVIPAGDREWRMFPVPKSPGCSLQGTGSRGYSQFPNPCGVLHGDREMRLFPVPKSLLDSLVGTGR